MSVPLKSIAVLLANYDFWKIDRDMKAVPFHVVLSNADVEPRVVDVSFLEIETTLVIQMSIKNTFASISVL